MNSNQLNLPDDSMSNYQINIGPHAQQLETWVRLQFTSKCGDPCLSLARTVGDLFPALGLLFDVDVESWVFAQGKSMLAMSEW